MAVVIISHQPSAQNNVDHDDEQTMHPDLYSLLIETTIYKFISD
jgi:hypothetical protein